jgi:hypothetical protein
LSELQSTASDWVEHRRSDTPIVDLAVRLYERDRDAFASVLGSAIALRLFLFFVPATLVVVQLVFLLSGSASAPVEAGLQEAGLSESVSRQIELALRSQAGRSLPVLLGGIWLAAWAGRSLTMVLAAASAGSWRMTGRSKLTIRTSATVTGLVLLLMVVSAGLNRLRDEFGLAVATTSLVAAAAVFGLGWFAVCYTLPKPSSDPGALLPGSVLFGTCTAVVQWFMQFYLPEKIARSSEVMGTLGVSVAALGYLFVIGRLMSGSLVLNAVMWDRHGSLSHVVLGLPGVRRIPQRYERVAEFFDLPDDLRGARSEDAGGDQASDGRTGSATGPPTS